jgi:photosystem II stability/assembly factor-like uncharacterized protein
MKSTLQDLIILFSVIFAISLLATCKREENPIIQNNNWQTIYQDSTVFMSQIRFLDKNTGFVLATNSVPIDSLRGRQFVFKTSDAGKTWTKFACGFPTVRDGARMVAPINANTLIGAGYNIFKSIDSGLNWSNLNPTYVGSGFFSIYIKDSLNWVLADGNSITRTSNGGTTWKVVLTTEFPAPFSLFSFPSDMVGYATGGATNDSYSFGFLAKTLDGGQSWVVLNPGPWSSDNKSFPDVFTIQFLTEQIGFIFTDDGKLYKTLDGASTWSLIYDKKESAYTRSYFLSGGKTWVVDGTISLIPSDGDIIDLFFLKSGSGYAITRDSKIIKKNN